MANNQNTAAAAAAGGGNDDRMNKGWKGEGYYIFFNHLIGDSYEALQNGIEHAKNGGASYQPYPIKYVSNYGDDWTFACRQVQKAGEYGKYPCGDAMPSSFFDGDKMAHTINMIILYVGKRSGTKQLRRKREKYATYAFAVIRDLRNVSIIRNRIETVKSREEFGGSEYFDSLMKGPAKIKEENCLYTEGLCAASEAGKGRGTKLMDLIHILAYYSGYDGCKLSALSYVIQYYFNKFSYRFRKGCEEGETPIINRLNNEVNKLPRISGDEIIEEEVAETTEDRPWPRFIQSLTNAEFNPEVGAEQGKTLDSLRNFIFTNEDDDDLISTRKAEIWERLGMLEQGFKMYFCFRNNPLMGVIQGRPTPFTQFVVMEEEENEDRGWKKVKKKSKKKKITSSIINKNPFASLYINNSNSNSNNNSNSNTQQSTQQSNSNTQQSTQQSNSNTQQSTQQSNTNTNTSGGRRTRRKRKKRRRRRTRKKRGGRRKTRRRRKKRRRTRKKTNL